MPWSRHFALLLVLVWCCSSLGWLSSNLRKTAVVLYYIPQSNGVRGWEWVVSVNSGDCHYLTNRFQMKAPVAPSRSLQEGSAKPSRSVSSRRLRGASKAPPRTLRGGLRTLRGGCTYRRFHEDALEGSRGLLEGSMDELHVPTRSWL